MDERHGWRESEPPRRNRLKRALEAGEVQVGTWIHTLSSPLVPQILATAGFDYVNIDMEHSSFSIESVGALCYASLHAGLTPIVRPAGVEHHSISRPLDNGAVGVLIPHVDTPQEAAAAVRAVKFPPLGDRGSQPPSVHTDFGATDTVRYMESSNRESMIMVQIESRQAIENLDSILTVPGVDGAVIGRGDLSADLGVAGQRDHPDVRAAVDALIAACQRYGKFPGLLVNDVDEAIDWKRRGIRMITYGSEVNILRNAATAAVKRIRSAE